MINSFILLLIDLALSFVRWLRRFSTTQQGRQGAQHNKTTINLKVRCVGFVLDGDLETRLLLDQGLRTIQWAKEAQIEQIYLYDANGRLKARRDALLAQASDSGHPFKLHIGWNEDHMVSRDNEVVSRIDSSSAASLSSSVVAEEGPLETALQEPYLPPAITREHQPPASIASSPDSSQRGHLGRATHLLSVNLLSSIDAYQALEHCESEGLEPNLIIILGDSFKLHGYPPHHSRVSELVHFRLSNTEDAASSFDLALDRFRSTEQRFGR